MRKILCGALVVGCMLTAAYADSGAGPFLSVISQNDEMGYGGGLKYEWLWSKNWGADIRASYVTDGDDSVIPLEIGLLGIMPLEGLSLYAGIGGGYYIFDVSTDVGGASLDADPEFGYYALAGLRIPLANNVELFLEAKYTKAEYTASDTSTQRYPWGYTVTTTEIEGGLDGIGGNAGVLWRF